MLSCDRLWHLASGKFFSTLKNKLVVWASSAGRRCSVVMLDGPGATPRLADPSRPLSSNGPRARGSRLSAFLKASEVAWFLGANAAPSSACRTDENSPNDTNISTLVARLSRSSCARLFDLLREMAPLSSHSWPRSNPFNRLEKTIRIWL